MKKRILSITLCIALCVSMVAMLAGCKGKKGADAFVIMTDSLDGLFNPFFGTAANDVTVVGQTQIGMLGAKYNNGDVEVAYGEDEPVVTKDYDIVENDDGTVTYTFVLKNGIQFSDGHPLTMEDVLFNYYTYLDPVYTGSNTLYSTKILGLSEYRTQTVGSSDNDSMITSQATSRAKDRINELKNLFYEVKKASPSSEAGYEAMKEAILSHGLSSGYIAAISNNPSDVTNENLQKDYDYALKLFKEELGRDYNSAQESYHDAPYDSHEEFNDAVFCFMYAERYVEVEYEKVNGKIDRTQIKKLTKSYPDTIKTEADAIEYVFNDKISRELDGILTFWATAGTLTSEFAAKAKEVILHENISDDGSLAVQNISGIVSLAHTDKAGSKITVQGNEYTIASGHNEDGTVTNADEYDVLQITIEGVDPKAIWNFSITIAPQHYYGEGSKVGVDIPNSKFGVEFASFDFMSKVVQSPRNVKLPMGAGPYMVTDAQNNDNPKETEFYKDNVVYLKANDKFETVGTGLNNAKIGKIRYQIISSNNALAALENGSVHYITPALTTDNYEKLNKMGSKGYEMVTSDQLGYGYIGINASKVKDINLRKAIMCAMNTSLALDYYRAGTATQIFWPMSKVSWAYPTGDVEKDNGKDYPQMGTWSKESAIANVKKYMQKGDYAEGDKELTFTFTIAGSTLQDHPTYKVFRDAAALLNELGWNVDVVCDTQALTKINTGSLDVWAAAWSSSLDPDLYQVYHKNSTATSTKAWGYDYIKTSGSPEEQKILDDLSELIDQARETNDKAVRKDLYQNAMGYILDLAVELPVYQRDVLYAYNSNVIDKSTIPTDINPFSSPLDRIWEIEFAK